MYFIHSFFTIFFHLLVFEIVLYFRMTENINQDKKCAENPSYIALEDSEKFMVEVQLIEAYLCRQFLSCVTQLT